jgi:hypothetical protein
MSVLAACLVLCAAVHVVSAKDPASLATGDAGEPVSNTAVDQAIRLAADYTKRNCDGTGKFVYRVNLKTHQSSSHYDPLRHAGTMYGLGMYNHYVADSNAVAAMVRAGGLLRSQYMERGPKPDLQCLIVWSSPPTNWGPFSRGALTTDLGGNGLGLIALTELDKVQPEWISVADLEAMGRFILRLQKADGSFYHRFRDQRGPVKNWECLYYPGEAACGLISLYEADHSQEWLNAAGKALSYLAKSRVGMQTVPDDHWALMATARLLPYYNPSNCPATRAELVHHAVQICQAMLSEQVTNAPDSNLNGAFNEDGRTTPTATRLEGLLAALEFLPDDQGKLREQVNVCVRRGINFLLRAQFKTGEYAGGMPGAIARKSGKDAQSAAFEPKDIRIDYVQHAMCAMIRFQKLFPAGGK